MIAAESNPSYQLGEWIDDHPLEYVALVTVAVHTGAEIIHGLGEVGDSAVDPETPTLEDIIQSPTFPASEPGSTGPLQSPYGFPENNGQSPVDPWDWRGNGEPGSPDGSWVNPEAPKENLRWDPYNHKNISPEGHWDYRDPNGQGYRIWPDGSMTPK